MAIAERVGSIVSTYNREVLKFGLAGFAGIELAQGRLITAAAWGALGAYYAISDRGDTERAFRNAGELAKFGSWTAHGEGRRLGRADILGNIEKLSEAQFKPGDPVYTPLDGSSPIQTPIELMQSLGGDTSAIAMRVELILRHAKKRESGKLTTAENETLRRAQTLIRLAHIGEGDLNEAQTRRYYEIGDKVFQYEYATRKTAFNK